MKKLIILLLAVFFIENMVVAQEELAYVAPATSSTYEFSASSESALAAKKKRRKSKKRKKGGKRGGSSDDAKFMVAINGGIAIPFGDLKGGELSSFAAAGTDTVSDNAGNTIGLGYVYNLTFSYKFIDYFGAMVLLGGQTHPHKTLTTESQLPGIGGVKATMSGTPFQFFNYMAGPVGILPLGDFSLELRALLGGSSVTTPSTKTVSTVDFPVPDEIKDMFDIGTIETEKWKATGFAYMFGITAKYNINEMFSLMANFDYFGTNPTFKVELPSILGITIPPVEAKAKLSSFNISVGFGIRF